jgi:hypothetical protein
LDKSRNKVSVGEPAEGSVKKIEVVRMREREKRGEEKVWRIGS